jgi:hypothetical protein
MWNGPHPTTTLKPPSSPSKQDVRPLIMARRQQEGAGRLVVGGYLPGEHPTSPVVPPCHTDPPNPPPSPRKKNRQQQRKRAPGPHHKDEQPLYPTPTKEQPSTCPHACKPLLAGWIAGASTQRRCQHTSTPKRWESTSRLQH